MQLEASSYGTGFGILAAAAQWIRKRFRNRGKTRLDLEAEKEAARINRTCGALEEMLFEYFLHAREGSVGPEALGELTGVLREVTEYSRAGKLPVPVEKDLEAMCSAAAGITAALSGGKPLPPPQETEGTDAFFRMLDQLLLQSQLLTGTSPD